MLQHYHTYQQQFGNLRVHTCCSWSWQSIRFTHSTSTASHSACSESVRLHWYCSTLLQHSYKLQYSPAAPYLDHETITAMTIHITQSDHQKIPSISEQLLGTYTPMLLFILENIHSPARTIELILYFTHCIFPHSYASLHHCVHRSMSSLWALLSAGNLSECVRVPNAVCACPKCWSNHRHFPRHCGSSCNTPSSVTWHGHRSQHHWQPVKIIISYAMHPVLMPRNDGHDQNQVLAS